MIKLYDCQISDLFTNGAKHNPEIKALSYAVLKEKQRIINQADRTRTLALIDELPETILDILAVELRTPLYQENFSIGVKRELIKDTLIYYTYMGTPEATNRMLSAIFPGSYIEEWYTYGGNPGCFQIILDMSDFKECAVAAEIIEGVKKVKRLTAHIDELVYQCSIGIIIETHGKGYKHSADRTGKSLTGTEPWRNKRGGFAHGELEAVISADGYECEAPVTGTEPYRSFTAGLNDISIAAQSQARPYKDKSGMTGHFSAGEAPYRNTAGIAEQSLIKVRTDEEFYGFESELMPAKGNINRENIVPTVTAENFAFPVKRCGTSLTKSK